MANIGVETAQHVQLNYKPASILDRCIAYFLDLIVIGAYWIFLISIGSMAEGSDSPVDSSSGDEYMWLTLLIIFLPIMLYHLVIEILWNGYSVGKWLIGIRVVKLDGTQPELSNYLLRWLIRLFEVTATSGGVALVAVLINGKGQRLGDIAAKTCVIKLGKRTKLSDTVFENFKEEYEAVFPQVMELSDDDISIINEVLKASAQYDYATWIRMTAKTRMKIQEKMGIGKTNMTDPIFLKQVIKDYNALHGVLE